MEVNRIYNEDCLSGIQHIPDNSIDLILTDPPYLISRDTNFSKGGGMSEKYGSISMDFGSWDKGSGIDMNILFSEIETTWVLNWMLRFTPKRKSGYEKHKKATTDSSKETLSYLMICILDNRNYV